MAKKRRVSAIVMGGMMVLGGISGLFWNEWRSAHRIATLIEGEGVAQTSSNGKVLQNHDGALAHLAAEPVLDGLPLDPDFGLERAALKLERRVEMYQWQERQETNDQDRQIIYERVWSERRIASERFVNSAGHSNPPFPALASETHYPKAVRLGDYGVRQKLLARIGSLKDVPPPSPPLVRVADLGLAIDGGYLATGALSSPRIGDVRISFREAPLGIYSVLGGQSGTELGIWQASNGGDIGLIEAGTFSMAEMFDQAYTENSRTTWLIRGGLTVAIFIGFTMLLQRLARMIPLLGMVAAKFAKPLAFLLTAATALVTIAAGWLIFRPLLSLSLMVVALAVIVGIRWLKAENSDDDIAHIKPPPPPPATPPAPPPPAPAA